ncbi:MAG: hypothetical protein FWF53_07120 [Candidatus Azobacteroides sp.]|nr:hypothetical protein [Candidatus Azobacteroides sp.]
MEKTIGKEYSNKAQREAYLRDNCDKSEEKGYMKSFTPEELQEHKENLAELSIKIEQVEDEKKESVRYFKEKLDSMIKSRKETVKNIREKSEYVRETCYKFVDMEERQTGYYNSEGDLIELRPSNADELQLNVFNLKTGTNN